MPRYDAFLSYSHADDGAFGPQLQALLEGFARTGRRRALRAFRDEQNLAADPDLWGSIEQALADSAWFVLLASPAAARSPWVDKEVAWWLDHRSPDRLIVALTEPEPTRAEPTQPDEPAHDIPLPPVLLADGAPRPAVVDLTGISRAGRLDAQDPLVQRSVAELASGLHDRPVPDLIAADAARHRREASFVRRVIATLATLFVVALVAAYLAGTQTDRAAAETRVANAHLLATTALATSATDLERAALLAVEGYRLHPDTQTLTALLRSVNGSSPIGARAGVDDEVLVAAAAPAAGAVLVGTETGEILRWDLRGAPVRVTTLDARPSALATSADGSVIAVATTGADPAVWVHADDRTRKVQDEEAIDVAVDPAGRRYATVRWSTTEHTVSVRATADDAVVAEADLAGTSYDAVRLQDDAMVLHQRWTNGGLGPWQRRSLPGLDVLDEGTVLDGDLADDVAGGAVATTQATTADGRWVMTQLDDVVHGARTTDGTTVSVQMPTALGTFPLTTMALSPSGTTMLLSRRDEVWIVHLPPPGGGHQGEQQDEHRAERLTGIGTPDGAVFLNDGLLVMTHGRTLTTWDVGSGEALAETTMRLEGIPRDKALTPDGATVVSAGELPDAVRAAVGAQGTAEGTGQGTGQGTEPSLWAMTHTFDTTDGAGPSTGPGTGSGTGPDTDALHLRPALTQVRGSLTGPSGARLLPVPLADGTLLFVDAGAGTVFEAAAAPATGDGGSADDPAGDSADDSSDDTAVGPAEEPDVPPLELRYETRPGWVQDAAVDHAGRLVLAGANGSVQVRDVRTGELLDQATVPAESATATTNAQISPDGRFVAFHRVRTSDPTLRTARIEVLEVATSTVHGQDLSAGRLVSRANDRTWQSQVDLAFGGDSSGGDYLVAAHAGGIAVLDQDGGSVRRTIAAPTSGRQNAVAPVPGTTLVAVAGDADWIRLFDTATGEEVGHLSALAGGADGDSPLWLAAGQDTLWAVGPRYLTRWDVRPAQLHARACEFAARNLTADEWRQAVAGSEPPADLACDRPLGSS